jgi:glycosyltransferase involved in cell wall biosynthesis
MALGVPVVSTAHMGTADIVRPERGARSAPDDEEGFARLVLKLLADPQARMAMSIDARAYAATWSAEAMAAKMAEFYRDVADRATESRGLRLEA